MPFSSLFFCLFLFFLLFPFRKPLQLSLGLSLLQDGLHLGGLHDVALDL